LLDAFVRGLGYGKTDGRSLARAEIYAACRDAPVAAEMVECDSPVGSGKTTAVMAHLLRAAIDRQLRRVFVVLPFTNIINQSVDVYRQALVWPGENPEEVVAAHHHRVDFESLEARQFTVLWHAPVVVTTAVQFFETLASRHPAGLRKLHQLPGSAIFIDEAHTALPASLWPQAWKWLRELVTEWGCHVVFGSGSLNRFWTLEDFVKPTTTLPPLVQEQVRTESFASEATRVQYLTSDTPFGLDELARWLGELPGPRLLIVNTVQSAAAIGRHLAGADRRCRERVEHLSTSLCPRDREVTLNRVKLRLKDEGDIDWTLVATSCVEAGVDVSFRTGIRERCSLTSLLQTAGRVNRSFEFGIADVWDIPLRHDHLLRPHPAFEDSARVLGDLFNEHDADGQVKVSPVYCTEALRREIRRQGPRKITAEIDKAERSADFPNVEDLFRVIASDTVTAIVDSDLKARLDAAERVSREEIVAGSVQIWSSRVPDWGLREFEGWVTRSTRRVDGYPDLLAWALDYDDFLGYMAGVLPLVDQGETAYIV
jgi:CRISPR-associated endonuclease/helicase Cas3